MKIIKPLNIPFVEALPAQLQLGRESLIRSTYRSLINLGRAYAAFPESELRLIEKLPPNIDILDPMSGYGLLTLAASQIGRGSYTVEMNPPQYLWQLLTNPSTVDMYRDWIKKIQRRKRYLPVEKVRVATSRGWYSPEALQFVQEIYKFIEANAPVMSNDLIKLRTIALFLPFVGRFSANIPDNNPTHVKLGGLCVFRGWQEDFTQYLDAIEKRLELIERRRKQAKHVIAYGDARGSKFDERKFGAMLTSPPYPNRSDYYDMFAPENELLCIGGQSMTFPLNPDLGPLIGTVTIGEGADIILSSKIANQFLEKVKFLKRSAYASKQDERYYFRILRKYFADLESAYRNVAKTAAKRFTGFILVANNTHRNTVIPVDRIIVEIWESLGFEAKIYDEKESFHTGTKNPRARGLRARHTSYVIKVQR